MIPAFDLQALDRGLAGLDGVPDALVPTVITLPQCTLAERCAGVVGWRQALLRGAVPAADLRWPPEPHGSLVRDAVLQVGVARFCKDHPELTDAVLEHVVGLVAEMDQAWSQQVAVHLRELEALEARRAKAEKKKKKSQKRSDEDLLAEARAAVQDELAAHAHDTMSERWGARVRLWAELSDVFGSLGRMLGLGWDLSLGVMRHVGWQDLLRIRALVEQLPQLKALVHQLGRLKDDQDGPVELDTVMVGIRRTEEELQQVRSPLARSETRGIERSDDISRMLPSEAALLLNPTLRLLWHARRAERALVSYRYEGLLTERSLHERDGQEERNQPRPRPARGPIVVCLDTSGSMAGLPERVAKAVTFECMRVAHAENRRCFLYAFSGPGQVSEQELDLSPDGIGTLLAFLGTSFHGGTDVDGPLRSALDRLARQGWERADILVVSDGVFPVSQQLRSAVRQATDERQARVHGLGIGTAEGGGLRHICDPVHLFQDWDALAGMSRRL